MSGRSSTKLVIIGVAVFVAGAGLVFVGLRGDEPAAAAPPAAKAVSDKAPKTTVVSQAGGVKQAIAIPAGMEAVAVDVSRAPGLSGYARAGDRINLYAVIGKGRPPGALEPPFVRLVRGGVLVLDTKPEGGFLLALDSSGAEQAIFLSKFESLWFTLLPDGAKPSVTDGYGYADKLVQR